MKKLPLLPLVLALALALAPAARADVAYIPGLELMYAAYHNYPIVLIIILLIVTALLVRHFTKKK